MKPLLFIQLAVLTFIGYSFSNVHFEKNISSLAFDEPTETLIPGQSTVLKFTSMPENGRQDVLLRFSSSGTYSLTLSSANPPFSDHWVIWDCINLKDGNTIIWRIGEDESPPDYSNAAFDEFCPAGGKCLEQFKVGTTPDSSFPKEVNDNSITKVNIEFEIGSKYTNKDLQLELSTLYSTHSKVADYRMKVALN